MAVFWGERIFRLDNFAASDWFETHSWPIRRRDNQVKPIIQLHLKYIVDAVIDEHGQVTHVLHMKLWSLG